jgi:hypothetical protein
MKIDTRYFTPKKRRRRSNRAFVGFVPIGVGKALLFLKA